LGREVAEEFRAAVNGAMPSRSNVRNASSEPADVHDKRSRTSSPLRSKSTPWFAFVKLKPLPDTSTMMGLPGPP
jgi:hypothetical protein